MRDRRDLLLMKRLADVQRSRRAGAEAALSAARAAEAEARACEEEAARSTVSAEQEWLDHLGGRRFSPEFGMALSARLVERENEARAASLAARRSEEDCGRRESEWQTQEARVRIQQGSIAKLSRRLNRRAEEKRLSAAADQATYSWSRS